MPRKKIKRSIRHRLRDHFIPHPGNNHLPHALKHRSLLIYSAILIGLKILSISVALVLPSGTLYSSAVTPATIIDLTNQTRREAHLSELTINSKLSEAAYLKAQDMLENQYFAHKSPVGATAWSFMKKVGYRYQYAGENLAVHFATAEDVESGWLASPTHKANILDPAFKEIGVGVSEGQFEGVPTIMVVQLFGEPLQTALAAAQPSARPTPSPVRNRVVPPQKTAPDSVFSVHITSSSESAIQPTVLGEDVKVALIPKENTYAVQVMAPKTKVDSVAVQLGKVQTPLSSSPDKRVWSGVIPVNPSTLSQGGERLTLTTQAKNVIHQQEVGYLFPWGNLREMYGGSAVRLWVTNAIQNGIQWIYVLAIFGLMTVLSLMILVKMRIQHPIVVGHAAFVIVLGFLLLNAKIG